MKSLALLGALALAAFGLSACNPSAAITTANNDLATLANNDIPAACGIVAVAEGYFATLKPSVSAANQAIETKAAAVVAPICANPPTNVTQAFTTLMTEWTLIQNATTTSPS